MALEQQELVSCLLADPLARWFEERGGVFGNIHVVEQGGGDRCVVTAERVREGAVLFSVPEVPRCDQSLVVC